MTRKLCQLLGVVNKLKIFRIFPQNIRKYHPMYVITSLFPLVHTLSVLVCLFFFIKIPSALNVLMLVLALFVLPIVGFKIHDYFFPTTPGLFKVSQSTYCNWYGAYQFQFLFNAMPSIERTLCTVPGLYSFWLRCWGSRIGKGVLWPPAFKVLDRNLLDIDNEVMLGMESVLTGHFAKPARMKNQSVNNICVGRIKIGRNSFIGGSCMLTPGVTLAPETKLDFATVIYPFVEIGRQYSAKPGDIVWQ